MLKQISTPDFIYFQNYFCNKLYNKLITAETSKNDVHEGKKLKGNLRLKKTKSIYLFDELYNSGLNTQVIQVHL